MASKDGYANLLAMPFGAGITVAARNRGAKPIEKVGVSMSVDRATDKNRADYAGRMRLRGVFQPAGTASQTNWRKPGWQRPLGVAGLLATRGRADRHRVAGGRRQAAGRLGDARARRVFWPARRIAQFHRALSGRRGDLSWRYMLLAPVKFEQSLVLAPNAGDKMGDRLALFYVQP